MEAGSPQELSNLIGMYTNRIFDIGGLTGSVASRKLKTCLAAGAIKSITKYATLILSTIEKNKPPSWDSNTVNVHAISTSTAKALESIQSGDGTVEIDKFALAKFNSFMDNINNALPQIQDSLKSENPDVVSKFAAELAAFKKISGTFKDMMGNTSKATLSEMMNRGGGTKAYTKEQIVAALKVINSLSSQMDSINVAQANIDKMKYATSESLMKKIFSTFSTIDDEVDSQVEQDNIMLAGATQVQNSANKLLSDLAEIGRKTPIVIKPLEDDSDNPDDNVLRSLSDESKEDVLKSFSNKYFDATDNKEKILADIEDLKKQIKDKSSSDWGEVTKSDALTEALNNIESTINGATTIDPFTIQKDKSGSDLGEVTKSDALIAAVNNIESKIKGAPIIPFHGDHSSISTDSHIKHLFLIKMSDLKDIQESVTDITSTSNSIIQSTTVRIQKDLTQGAQENAMYGSLMDKVFNMIRTVAQSGVAL